MQAHDTKSPNIVPTTLTAAQVADRMGLTTRQLQDLRLRGIGPPIVQRGLSIHYQLADVQEIEQHEAEMLIEQVLASNRPLAMLRAMAAGGALKLSPILQQAVPPSAVATMPIATPAHESPTANPAVPTASATEVPEPDVAALTDSMPAPAASPPPAQPTLTVITCPTNAWYLVHTKPRQEDVALANLQRQGYACYLPQMRIERIRRRKVEIATEPMFPRYLFIRLDSSDQGKSWSPIRSTLGVSQLVHFGARAAKVADSLVDLLRQRERTLPTEAMFHSGDSVVIADGPFAGIEAIYQTADAERRAFILLEILAKPVSMHIDAGRLRKAG
jgi:transcriptional antiterminator RfaH